MLLSTLAFYSCSDGKESMGATDGDRVFMTMFRQNDNTGKGDTDPYRCQVTGNTVYLYWYAVNDAAGYEIKWSRSSYVTGGEEAWLDTEAQGRLAGDTIIAGADVIQLVIEHLDYQTDYRFAIRALHSLDKNDPKNSLWYGYGNGQQWQDYMGLQTAARYSVPNIITNKSDITKHSLHLSFNSKVDRSDANIDTYLEHFNVTRNSAGDEVWRTDYLTVEASLSTPNAKVPDQYKKIALTEEILANGIDLQGLDSNSVYMFRVWDETIEYASDAYYDFKSARMKGDPAAPRLIKHTAWATDSFDNDAFDISQFQSMGLDTIISNYNQSMLYAENQVFYLEGGKAYHFRGNPQLYKGLTLATNPEDVAKGLRATVHMSGLLDGKSCNFMLGRTPEAGEVSSIPIDIDSIRFQNIDFDCPYARNYGNTQDGTATGTTGNYFSNMYSNGMGINVAYYEISNCTFQGLIRGFFRIQGSNDFNIKEFKLIGNAFYNLGWYGAATGGYQFIFGDHGNKTKSNIFNDLEIAENVFFDTAHGTLVTDNGRNNDWDESVRWNINVHHNTFVNIHTISNQPIMQTRRIPGGSVLTFEDNLIILTKKENDTRRTLNSDGWQVDAIQGGDGTGKCVINVRNNYSTNDNLTAGQVFSNRPFSAASGTIGRFQTSLPEMYTYGVDALLVKAEDISATELMVDPNPARIIEATDNHLDHATDKGISGLYYKNTTKVLNSEIYTKQIGASILRTGLDINGQSRDKWPNMFKDYGLY